jgi:2-polyprenyl-6-hydroxyphenyl methylase/3-demethylubiquinone-9 3-methyltransferase
VKRLHHIESWPQSWKDSFFYDQAEIYDEITHFGYFYAYAQRRQKTLELVTEVLPAGARILDIAAAQGNFSLALSEMGYQVTWNDLRADLSDYVRLKYEKGSIEFAPGNVFALHFPFLFDGVLITEIIEHVAHPDDFLHKTAELVRPGGYIVMTTPNGAYFRNRLPKFSDCLDTTVYEVAQFRPNADGHIFLLYPQEIRQLAAMAGLTVERLELFTNPITAGHMKSEWLLRRLPSFVVERLEHLSQNSPESLRERLMVHTAARFRR